jgi:hypothetical protein
MRLQVFSLAQLRCFGPLLLALFVLAQAVGDPVECGGVIGLK